MQKPPKNEELICGWANENDVNQDTIKLNSIIKRKSTIEVLPQLNMTKSKMQTVYRKHFSNTKLGSTKNVFFRLSNHQPILFRQKTEPCYDEVDPSPTFRNQKIFKAVQQVHKNIISPSGKDSQHLQNIKRKSNNHQNITSPNKNQKTAKQDKKKLPFFKISQYKDTKSHDFIGQNNQDKSKSPQKTQPKFYLKLSTLSNINGANKQFRFVYNRNTGSEACMSEQRDAQKRKKMHLDILNRINQKFKESFTKKDIFHKNKKTILGNKLQVSSDMNPVFSENSVLLEKYSLHSKLRQLNRYNFDFK